MFAIFCKLSLNFDEFTGEEAHQKVHRLSFWGDKPEVNAIVAWYQRPKYWCTWSSSTGEGAAMASAIALIIHAGAIAANCR